MNERPRKRIDGFAAAGLALVKKVGPSIRTGGLTRLMRRLVNEWLSIKAYTGVDRSCYGWAILDPSGVRVLSGYAPSRAAAVLAAERAIWRLQQTRGIKSAKQQRLK
jgi:hypothetical protein